MLGTYEKRKGHDFLFKAFDKVYEENQNVSLIVCGDSKTEDRKYVESLRLKSKSRNKIYLLNYINNGSLLIKQADILLIASQEWESFGWTAIESMARKIPVVSTNSGG